MAKIEQYKKISEMIPETSPIAVSEGMFPFIIPGVVENYIVSHKDLVDSMLGQNKKLTLQTDGTIQTTYNGVTDEVFNVTPSNIGTYNKTEIDALISGVVAESFIQYTGADIISTGQYTVDPKREMMYSGGFNSNVTLQLNKPASPAYGTTYMFIRNTDTVNEHTITLTNSDYYLPDTNVITVPAATNIEIATKMYGNIAVTTYLLGLPGEESSYVTLAEVLNAIDSALANYYTKAQTYSRSEINDLINGIDLSNFYTKAQADARFAPTSHTHANLTLQVAGTTKSTYNGGTATTYNVTPDDLNVYTKGDTYTRSEVNSLISTGTADALLQSTGNNNSIVGGTLNFTMYENKDTHKYLETNASFSIVESGSAAVSNNTKFNLFVKNTGSSTITITLPVGTNSISYDSSVDVEAGKGVEIIVMGYGIKRITTYLPFINI